MITSLSWTVPEISPLGLRAMSSIPEQLAILFMHPSMSIPPLPPPPHPLPHPYPMIGWGFDKSNLLEWGQN